MSADVQRVLQAIGEPTRFRILELLATRPHAVGEVAAALGALQPQTTKHLQALEAAQVIRVHRLGRRRVAALDHDSLAAAATFLAEVAREGEDDDALRAYSEAVSAEEARLGAGQTDRSFRFERDLAVDPDTVWKAWTDPDIAPQWWAPRHFSVTAFELQRRPGSAIRVALREGDGVEHHSRGRVEVVDPDTLVFSLSPLGPSGDPLFEARHTLTLTGTETTRLELTIEVRNVLDGAAAAVAGVRPGWEQLLDSLARTLEGPQPTGKVSTSS